MPLPLLAQAPERWPDRDLLRKNDIMKVKRAPAAGVLLAPEPTANQLLYDVVHYEIDVGINPYLPEIEGRVKMTAVSRSAGAPPIDIDADNTLTSRPSSTEPATPSSGPTRIRRTS